MKRKTPGGDPRRWLSGVDKIKFLQMRTALEIDADVLQAAREMAAKQKRSVGAVISDLARRGLHAGPLTRGLRNGVPLLPSRGEIITMSHVREILDEADQVMVI